MTARPFVFALATVATLAGAPGFARATTYVVDADHTTVGFTVRHLFSRVTGRFDKFDGSITFDPAKPEATKVEGSVMVASINTNVEKRDTHLKSADFFDAANHPTLSFTSGRIVEVAPDKHHGKMEGTLTIRGTAKPVLLDVAFLGEGTDPWGNRRAGFSATTTINRKDFGLNWNETLETGGVLVGDEITIQIDAEGMPKE